MAAVLSQFCIYTMRHSRDLDACAATGGSGSFTEQTAWVTGGRLFREAHVAGERMPVLFSAAERDSGLIYWAVLTDVSVENGDAAQGVRPSTLYAFADLTPIATPRRLSELALRDGGRPLSDSYIRPYAVCRTPAFL